jgi:hypothetical protein
MSVTEAAFTSNPIDGAASPGTSMARPSPAAASQPACLELAFIAMRHLWSACARSSDIGDAVVEI